MACVAEPLDQRRRIARREALRELGVKGAVG
jgi:hypothetical protein